MSNKQERATAKGKRNKTLDTMGLADLYKLAEQHGIPGAAQMSAADLRGAIKLEIDRGSVVEDMRAQMDEDNEAAGADFGVGPGLGSADGVAVDANPPTVSQPDAIDVAGFVQTAAPVSDGAQQFVITKGGRFARDGSTYTLTEGSVCSELTHSLSMLRAQGIKLEPIHSVEVFRDQLGAVVTMIDGRAATDFLPPKPNLDQFGQL